MTTDQTSRPSPLNTIGMGTQVELGAHTVQAKLGRLCFEMFVAAAAIYACIYFGKDAWFEGETVDLSIIVVLLVVAVWWFVSQLSAVSRLAFFGGACVMDQQGFKHFSMGTIGWRAVRGVELTAVKRDQDSDRMESFIVLGLDREAFDLMRPNWMRQLTLMRYARYSSKTCAVELSCDFLKIEPNRLLWHMRQRADRLGGQRLADWNGTEPVESAERRRKYVDAIKPRHTTEDRKNAGYLHD